AVHRRRRQGDDHGGPGLDGDRRLRHEADGELRDMIEFILQPANIIMALASVGAFLTIFAFGMPLLERDALSSRLKAVARRREELQAANRARNAPQKSKLRQQATRNYMKAIVERFKLLNPANSEGLKDKLAQAGKRGQGPLYAYAF